MGTDSTTGGGATGRDCQHEPVSWPSGPAHPPGSVAIDATLDAARVRLARLARAIESEVIPRLVEHHREVPYPGSEAAPSAADLAAVVGALVTDDGPHLIELLQRVQARSVPVAAIYADLLAPAARRLGELWEEDRVDFATVTVGLGRLQRLLRLLSPAFGSEVEHPPNGRRVVLTQPESEQHIFGLSMVAEFFRREGWDVLGGVAGVGIDAAAWVRRDWFDAVGFSIGSELSLPWLKGAVAAVRRQSRNPAVVVLVGGPLFSLHPAWVDEVGADATADGRSAPHLAETIMARRVQEQSGPARDS